MASEWHFYSLDIERFRGLFGHGDRILKEALVRDVSDPEHFDFEDFEKAATLVHVACEEGFSYDGRIGEEVDVLDCLVAAAIKVTRETAEYLDVKPLSPRGLSLTALEELARHAISDAELPDVRLLLRGGRRYGQSQGAYCSYIILTNHEVGQMLDKCRAVIAREPYWSVPEIRVELEQELVQPFAGAAEARQAVAGFFP